MLRLPSLSVLTALLTVILCSCHGGSGTGAGIATLAEAVRPGSYGVGVTTLDLVDRSRGVEANGTAPALSERKLTTEVWYPADPSLNDPQNRDVPFDRSGAPYPLVIFAHGLSSLGTLSASFTEHLASHGYIVAAPNFPLSSLTTPGGPRLDAVLDQPEDISFVIDSLLAMNGEAHNRFEHAVDASKIGLAGHSLGALTAFLTIYGPQRDSRIKAAFAISTPGCYLPDGFAGVAAVPIVLLWGTRDRLTPPVTNEHAYEIANAPKYRVEVTGADHTRFADVDVTDDQLLGQGVLNEVLDPIQSVRVSQALGSDPAACGQSSPVSTDPLISGDHQREILRATALTFFDAYLRGDRTARGLLRRLPQQFPETRVTSSLR